MHEAPFWSLYHDDYRVSNQFRSEYHERFGREAFVEASARSRWYGSQAPPAQDITFVQLLINFLFYFRFLFRNVGENVTEDEYMLYLSQIDAFRTWFNTTVMSLNGDESDAAIMVLPYGIDGPLYRDVPPRYVDACRAGTHRGSYPTPIFYLFRCLRTCNFSKC